MWQWIGPLSVISPDKKWAMVDYYYNAESIWKDFNEANKNKLKYTIRIGPLRKNCERGI